MSNDAREPPEVPDMAHEGWITVLRVTGGVEDQPLEAWHVDFESGLTAPEMRLLIKRIAYDFEQGIYQPHILKENRTDVDWGAESSFIEYVLEITEGVPAEAIYVGLGYAIRRVFESVSCKREAEAISLDAADGKCRQRIAATYSVQADTLHRIGESVDDSGRKVTLSYSTKDGTRYTASVSLLSDMYLTTHVARQVNEVT